MSSARTALASAGAVFVWQIGQVTISGYERYNTHAHRRIER